MWDELNRWWLGNRKPRPQQPEQLAVELPPDSENDPQPPRAEDVTEFENSLATTQPADTPQTVEAEESIQEPECVKASPDPSDSTRARQDVFDTELSSEPRADSDPPDPLDGKLDPPYGPADELIADLVDEPTQDLGESFPQDWADLETPIPGPLGGRPTRPRGRRLARPELEKIATLTPQQRLAILDCWRRSGLPAKDFAPLVGVSRHTLYSWKQRFERLGAAGFLDQPRGAKKGSRLPDATRRAIVALKESQPEWGCERISNMLLRSSALPASPTAVARVLHEAGYQLHESPTRPHPDHPRRFERARPNQLWQTDLFTFVLKRQNRRVYLVAFLDDHSRFIVSFGLHASQSTALVLEVFRAGLTAYGAPAEVLTDNGAQYVTWRGESAFHKELKHRGIEQIVARPRHPQTLGKIERFWGTLWRECLETAVFLDLADARARIGHFIDWYNLQRVHSGIDGLVPADRYFHAAPEMARLLKERVAGNALELARHGVPKPPFYLTGQVGGRNFSLHAEGERVFLTHQGKPRQEVDLVPPEAAGQDATAGRSDQNAMPPAVCPDGSPKMTSAIDSRSESQLEPAGSPGTSILDELTKIRQGSAPQAPGQAGGES
jgi:transposase InsO family protein